MSMIYQQSPYIQKSHPHFMERTNKHNDSTRITIGMRSRFFPTLYSDASLNYPMEVTSKCVSLGTTTVTVHTTIQHKTQKTPLYEHDIVVVNVYKASHMPVPLEKDIVEEYSQYCDNNITPRIESPSKPSGENGIFHCQRQAMWSDIDINVHVNTSHYLKFCLDAMSLFMKDNSYWRSLLVKQVTSVYKGEVIEGDIMDIYMWQSKTPNVLHFQIEVESKVGCNVTIKFYSKNIYSRL